LAQNAEDTDTIADESPDHQFAAALPADRAAIIRGVRKSIIDAG
jgi:hypothetical protein